MLSGSVYIFLNLIYTIGGMVSWHFPCRSPLRNICASMLFSGIVIIAFITIELINQGQLPDIVLRGSLHGLYED